MIIENQHVVFAKQSVVYISNVKNNFKESRDTEINTQSLYWFIFYQKVYPVLSNH